MSPAVIHDLLTFALGAFLFTLLWFVPAFIWAGISAILNRIVRRYEMRQARARYFAKRAAHREYVRDMFSQIR